MKRSTMLANGVVLMMGVAAVPAVEVTVQNDSVVNGSTAAIQAGFVAGESAAVWLTSPCNGDIVAVQVFWRSLNADQPQTIEDTITIHSAGTFPVPGTVLQEMLGPLMTDGVLNEFRFLDENQTIPLMVPITAGEDFVVSFKFFNSPSPFFGPSVVTDTNGCQNGRNAIDCAFGICNGWTNSCSLGISGDFMIRAVIDCSDDATGACCGATGGCTDNATAAVCLSGFGQYQGDFTSCGAVTCPATGACCDNGECTGPLLQTACTLTGGSYEGDGSDCGSVTCPEVQQACCFQPAGCLDLVPSDCQLAEGFSQGAGTDCGSITCFPTGACCNVDGSCTNGVLDTDCAASGGTFQGDGTDCGGTACPQPTGACCLSNGNCLLHTMDNCFLIPIADDWAGPLTTCADGDSNGIADACENATGDCTTVADCCDLNDNFVRDDNCAWCACDGGACNVIPLTNFADMGGSFGACPPDQFSNIHDRNHALSCFDGTNGCDPLNVDAGGSFGSCPPDGFCNIHDANHALTAFAGVNTCTCGPQPMGPGGDDGPAGQAALRVVGPRLVTAGEVFAVQVLVDDPLAALQSYQLALQITGGGAGSIDVVDITVEPRKNAALATDFAAFNRERGQMLAGHDRGSVATEAGSYLATFTLRANKTAAGRFVIDLDRAATFLIAEFTREVVIDGVTPAVVRIGSAPHRVRRAGH